MQAQTKEMLTRILLTFTQDEEEVHLFSISVIDLVCKGSGGKDCFCLLDEMTFLSFFLYINFKVDPFIFRARSRRWRVVERALNYRMKNRLKDLQITTGN